MGLFGKLFPKKEYNEFDYEKYPNISMMINKILNGPFAISSGKPDSNEFVMDGYRFSKYEDNIFIITSHSGTGMGKGYIPGFCNIELKDGRRVYPNNTDKDCSEWYNHLVEVYNKSLEIENRRNNLHQKVYKICDYVQSGYNDGMISVEYEKKEHISYSESEGENVSMNLYTCKIFLIPMGEYVYVQDDIYHKLDRVTREGKWVDYVCSLIDKFKEEEEKKYELENKRRRAILELEKQKLLMKKMKNESPIDDSYIFNKKMR